MVRPSGSDRAGTAPAAFVPLLDSTRGWLADPSRDAPVARGARAGRGCARAPRPGLGGRGGWGHARGHARIRARVRVVDLGRRLHDGHDAHDGGLSRGSRGDRGPGASVDDAARDLRGRDHLRVDRHRGRDDPERGRERPAGGEANARCGRCPARSLHRVRLRAGGVHGGPGARAVRPAPGRDRYPAVVAGTSGRRRAPRGRGRRDQRRDAAGGRDRPRPGSGHDDRFRCQQRVRDAVRAGDARVAVHRRPRQPRWVRGQAAAGRGEPGRVAVHDGRAPDRRACQPSAGRRLHRCRPVARQPVVLAGGDRGHLGRPIAGRHRRLAA